MELHFKESNQTQNTMHQINLSGAPIGAQFSLMRLQARRDAISSGQRFNADEFSMKIPEFSNEQGMTSEPVDPTPAETAGSTKGSFPGFHVTNLQIQELHRFDADQDGTINSNEYSKIYESNRQALRDSKERLAATNAIHGKASGLFFPLKDR